MDCRKNEYYKWVNQYIKLCEEKDKVISGNDLTKYNLPNWRWFIKHCPEDSVKSWNGFLDWCGFYATGITTKEKAIKMILQKAEKLNRPLMYDDFRYKGCYDVPLKYILDQWGTINNMKKDIGLAIIQESMTDKSPTKEHLDSIFLEIKNFILKSNKDFITREEIDNYKWIGLKSGSLDKWCHIYYNQSLREHLLALGINTGQQGRGIIFTFTDGETTTSQYEYLLSLALRNLGLIYNYDYFRNVNYSSFIHSYKGNMNCDYLIKYNDRNIYIEIPGVIEAYKTWYYSDKEITTSNSKEKYRKNLKRKEMLLKDNNIDYILLFPSDITINNIQDVLYKDIDEIRNRIEKQYKNNIDWNRIVELGELKYKSTKGKDNQYIVCYN